MGRTRSASRALARAATILVLTASTLVGTAAPAQAVPNYQVATQFVAKLYTEALGRAPDGPSWTSIIGNLTANGCSASTLGYWGKQILKSAEFASYYPLPDNSSVNFVNAGRIELLFRAGLNREPSPSEFNSMFTTLNASETAATWSTLVDNIFNGTAFASLVTGSICPANDSRRDPSAYYWNMGEIEPLGIANRPASQTCGWLGTTQASLQSALNATPSGGTLLLAQGVHVQLTQALVIPPGVTMRPCQPTDPGGSGLNTVTRYKYGLMPRLYRAWTRSGSVNVKSTTWKSTVDPWSNASVVLSSGAVLKHVFVDGGRDKPINKCEDPNPTANLWCLNVYMKGGAGTSVLESRLDNSGGWEVIFAQGASIDAAGWACSTQNKINDNLVTGYASSHTDTNNNPANGKFQDGIGYTCENIEVARNHVVDATDVSIMAYRSCVAKVPGSTHPNSGPTCPNTFPNGLSAQHDVHHNVILAAGNSAFGAVWLSGEDRPGPGWEFGVGDFTGTTVHDNITFTGVNTVFGALYELGIRMAFGYDCSTSPCMTASYARRTANASVTNNHTDGLTTYVQRAVGISGMTGVTLTGNNFGSTKVAGAGLAGFPAAWSGPFACPTVSSANGPGAIVAEMSSYEAGYPNFWWASGTISGNTVGTAFQAYDMPLVINVTTQPSGCVVNAQMA